MITYTVGYDKTYALPSTALAAAKTANDPLTDDIKIEVYYFAAANPIYDDLVYPNWAVGSDFSVWICGMLPDRAATIDTTTLTHSCYSTEPFVKVENLTVKNGSSGCVEFAAAGINSVLYDCTVEVAAGNVFGVKVAGGFSRVEGCRIKHSGGTYQSYGLWAAANVVVGIGNIITGFAYGIALNPNTDFYFVAVHNSVYDCAKCLYMANIRTYLLGVKANIFYAKSAGQYCYYTPAAGVGSVKTNEWKDVLNHNCAYEGAGKVAYFGADKTWAELRALGFEKNGINTDPLFTDPATDDFTLQASSPCRADVRGGGGHEFGVAGYG